MHPAWMIAGLILAALALRVGLAMRRSRLRRTRRSPEWRPRHLRFAKPAVAMLLLGFIGGPISAVWLRGWDAFDSFHGLVGLLTAGFFATAAILGRRIETGTSRRFDAHAILGGLGLLLAALAAVAGFVLLP